MIRCIVGPKQLEGYNEIYCISFDGSDLDDLVSFGGNPITRQVRRTTRGEKQQLCALKGVDLSETTPSHWVRYVLWQHLIQAFRPARFL
jgi:hypothetical protein